MNSTDFLPLRNLLPELNKSRAIAGLRPYTSADTARYALSSRACPAIKPDAGHTLFHRESALRIALRCNPVNADPAPSYPPGRYTAARALLKLVNDRREAAGSAPFHFRAGLITALIKEECPHMIYGADVIFHRESALTLAPSLKRPACDITQKEHQAAARAASAQRQKINAWLAQ